MGCINYDNFLSTVLIIKWFLCLLNERIQSGRLRRALLGPGWRENLIGCGETIKTEFLLLLLLKLLLLLNENVIE